MNKKIILLPFLMAGLLIGCTGKNAPAPTPEKEKELWELDLVEGETSIEDIRATANAYTNSDASADYFTARGTVVYNAGSTLAIYRNGHFLYCYNYNPTGTGVTEIAAHPLGSYVEVTGKIQNWSGPQMTAQPTSGTYDPDAKLTVLAEKGEEVAPVEVNTAAQFENAAATGVLAKVVYTADKDYELVANTSSHVQLAGEIEGMDKSKVSDPIVRCEKYVPAEVQTALFTNNPKLEEGSQYYMVGVLAGTTKGSARLMLGEGSSWTLKQAKVWEEPTGVTVTAAGSATSVEVGQQLQLSAVVAPAGARQQVTWSSSDDTKATVDQNGLVTGAAAAASVTITATAKEGVAGTITLEVAAASVDPLSAPLVFDFSGLANADGELSADALLASLKASVPSASQNLVKEVTNTSKIYQGNGTGGAHPGEAGMLKTGTSSANGTFTFVIDALFNKAVINCHDFYKASTQYPTTSQTIQVNTAAAQTLPYNDTGAWEDVTFTNLGDCTAITITVAKRATIRGITLSYVA